MSYDKQVVGWEKFDGFVQGLTRAGTAVFVEDYGIPQFTGSFSEDRYFRMATWITPDGRRLYAREYLSIESEDCDADDYVDFEVIGD